MAGGNGDGIEVDAGESTGRLELKKIDKEEVGEDET